MNKLSKILLAIIIILIIALGVMVYYYFYWRTAYISSVNQSIETIERLQKIEGLENRNEENVKIEVVKNSITPTGATIIITDNNENQYAWGEEYKIKVKDKNSDTWSYLKPINDISFNEIMYKLDENGQKEEKIDWSNVYGTLPSGTYQIIKHAYTPLQDIYFESEEFEIN